MYVYAWVFLQMYRLNSWWFVVLCFVVPLLWVMFAYIRVSDDWNDDRQRVKTHLPGVKGGVWWSHISGRVVQLSDGLIFEEEACGYNYQYNSWTVSWQRLCRLHNQKTRVYEALTHHYCCQHILCCTSHLPWKVIKAMFVSVCMRAYVCGCVQFTHVCVCACIHWCLLC